MAVTLREVEKYGAMSTSPPAVVVIIARSVRRGTKSARIDKLTMTPHTQATT